SILDGVGNLTARPEVAPHAAEVFGVHAADRRSSAAQEVSRLAALVDCGSNGRLLAKEAFLLVADTNSSEYAGVFEINHKGKRHVIEEHGTRNVSVRDQNASIQISTGSFGDNSYELVIVPIATASARSTIIAIQ